MKKSHFKFTKGQRSGIFLLLLIIFIMQSLYYFVDFSSKDVSVNKDELNAFQNEIDSLRLVEIESQQTKIFPFNPNYITDYKGYTLGMTPDEIDRLLKFREQNKWVNSAKQFQDVTKVSDSLLNSISPYFKFPEWVTNPKPTSSFKYQNDTPKTFTQKIDLNTATSKQLQIINGIGEKLSDRIIKFRNKFEGGFIDDIQLQDVYGISPEVLQRLLNEFAVKTPRQIKKIGLNTASIEQLVTVQHIDYEIAYEILDQRTLREGFKSLDELTKVKNFPVDKIEIIKLYLTLN
ncbi:helix-hairpin-helix domain-containing protein [Flavobacteriaceae bacterium S0825]|uniref:ComEA family DNA-binding protein n=1 Tax=Gaetbulibacter sp. S0825 TaxID=2720084 RepID=UPI00142FE33F|nr:helix-hairpin-helix domain-containing protein [Gaetbulibacter sp. S0825]MCK0110227.1 helix-hairpin-helix domain-containing protein [Flavobacteriaceae bacterium S0825]NIX65856.1 helix-hairpin-helix domain-containing protein [Gaetbulibacter sp. S0825]